MTPEDLDALSMRLQAWTGIDMRRGGLVPALQRYVDTRAGALRITSHELGQRIESAHSDETRLMLDALTVGHTWFFRDAGQLQTLSGLLLRDRVTNIWIPACASGEEAYSVAMIAAECGADVRILATDINSDFLRQAELGEYSEWSVREVPARFRHMLSMNAVRPELKKRIRFQRHNVNDAAPAGPWDIVLCRNMLIYFAHAHATAAVSRMGEALADDGALIVGAADLNFDCPPALTPQSVDGRWLLRRTKPSRARPVVTAPLQIDKHFDLGLALSIAHDRLFAGDLHAAEPLCRTIISEEPLNAEGHFLLGVLHLHRSRPKEALHALRTSLLLAPRFWPAAHYLERLAPPSEAHAARALVASAESISGSGRALLDQLEALRPDLIRRAEKKLLIRAP